MRGRLYKFFSETRWAEAFLRGELLFRSLAYFRDQEDGNVRQDTSEGVSIYRPEGDLVITNHTQGTRFTMPASAFESAINQEEIFVYCVSRSFSDELRERFHAEACVEVHEITTFCNRVQAALPESTQFPGLPGRTRIGHRVDYYVESDNCSPRWALPDVIATSKLESYRWQDEFRLVFSLTNALAFENVTTRIVKGQSPLKQPNAAEHHFYPVTAGPLADICELHVF